MLKSVSVSVFVVVLSVYEDVVMKNCRGTNFSKSKDLEFENVVDLSVYRRSKVIKGSVCNDSKLSKLDLSKTLKINKKASCFDLSPLSFSFSRAKLNQPDSTFRNDNCDRSKDLRCGNLITVDFGAKNKPSNSSSKKQLENLTADLNSLNNDASTENCKSTSKNNGFDYKESYSSSLSSKVKRVRNSSDNLKSIPLYVSDLEFCDEGSGDIVDRMAEIDAQIKELDDLIYMLNNDHGFSNYDQ